MTHLDEKALEASYDLPWALEEFTRNGQRCANIVSNDGTIVCEIRGILDACGNRENGELIVRAVNSLGALSALPSSPVSELVDARKLWKEHGGDQHGPHTERLTMPLDNFSGFVNALVSAAIQPLSTRNAELEREVKRLREAQFWRGMDSAPKAGERILLAWKPVGGLSEHVELGKWKDRQGWSNTYGHAFSEAPDAWAPLAPFSTSPQDHRP